MTTPISKIKEKIMVEHGLAPSKTVGKHRRLKPLAVSQIPEKLKTPKMKYLELKYREPIEKILLSGSLGAIAKRLNDEVDPSTLSKWIKKLKLRFTPDNLPSCKGCLYSKPACVLGVCYLLMELELWDLLELKKTEILEG